MFHGFPEGRPCGSSRSVLSKVIRQPGRSRSKLVEASCLHQPSPMTRVGRCSVVSTDKSTERVRDFLARWHKVAGRVTKRFFCEIVHGERGLLRLERLPLTAPSCASRCSRRAGCGSAARPISMSGDGKTGRWPLAPATAPVLDSTAKRDQPRRYQRGLLVPGEYSQSLPGSGTHVAEAPDADGSKIELDQSEPAMRDPSGTAGAHRVVPVG